MSSIGGSSGITFSGLASGIDTSSIISKIIQVDSIPLQNLQQQQQDLTAKQQIFAQLRTQLQAFQTAASGLNNLAGFSLFTANSSDPSVATISTTTGASAGTFNLSVSKLAQAQKISSAAQTDTTSGLGQTGTFIVNGKAVAVVANDSLSSIAQKINSAGAGVVASLINGGTGNAYLTLTANATGASNKIQISDLSGTTMGSLGLVSGSAAIRETITNGATSTNFANSSDPVGTLMALQGSGAGSFTINGTTVNVDLATDSLQSIANNINTNVAGVTATVRTVTDANGGTTSKLDISSGAGTPTFADTSGNILAGLGVLQKGYGSELVAAQDAHYKLDTVDLTSSTNTITTAIPGATLTLLKADATTPPTSTLTVSQDTAGIDSKVQAFVSAFNGISGFIKQNSTFDSSTFATGPLFGDATADQVNQSINNMLFNSVPGLTGQYTNLTALGFSLAQDGTLSVDDSVLKKAIATAPDAVASLFATTGKASTTDITYVSSSTKTVPSGAGSYAVNITALATKGSYMGELAQTTANPLSEKLTFNGADFANTAYSLTLNVGNSVTDTINQINSDAKLKDLVIASLDGSGKLLISSKKYGTGGNFNVVSNFTAANNNSGIGVGSLGTVVLGTDIQGTINGEAATGAGQFLTGNAGNANTDGLQIQYTGVATGLVGSLTLSKGIGSQSTDLMANFLDLTNGTLTAEDNALTAQATDLQQEITDQGNKLTQEQADLKAKFAAMEQAISQLQGQANSLASFGGLSAPSSTSKGTLG